MNSLKLAIIFCCTLCHISLAQLGEGEQACLEGKTLALQNSINKARLGAFPGDANYDAKYYKLDLAFDYTFNPMEADPSKSFSNKNMRASLNMKAQALQSISSFALDFTNGTLVVDSVFIGTNKTTNFTHENNKILINFSTNVAANQLFTTTVYYHGVPNSTGFGTFQWAGHPVNNTVPKGPAIWSLSEPYGAQDWFPVKDNPADKADSSDVWITAPKDIVSVSNGVLEEKIEGTTSNTYKWKSRYAISPYLISIALGNFDQIKYTYTNGAVSFPMEHYIYPEVNTQTVRNQLSETDAVMNVFIDKFGPYPFAREKYGHAQFGWGGGMEHQTCSSMVNFNSGLVAHELAHQWFGDKITCQDWQNIWLNEGFATFGALIYREAKNGLADYKAGITSTMNSAKTAQGPVFVQDPTNINSIFNSARSYSKGAIILHMLRNILGDTKFYTAIKAYSNSIHAYGNANTENFKNIVEASSGVELDYFFQQWIFGEKYPKYEWGWYAYPASGAKLHAAIYKIRLRINQLVNTSPTFFTMPVDLKFTLANGTTEIRRVFNNQQDQYFDLDFSDQVLSVAFDPENGILKDATFVPLNVPLALEDSTVAKVKEAEKKAKLDANELTLYPNPAKDFIELEFSTGIKNIQYKIFNNEGKELLSELATPQNRKIIVGLKGYATGLYFIKISAENSTVVRKFVVSK